MNKRSSSSSPPRRRSILVFNNGTYGDGAVIETVIKELKAYIRTTQQQDRFKIVFVTNKSSILPNGTQPQHVYEFPEFVLNDPLLGPADTSQSIFEYVLYNAFHVKAIADWSASTTQLVKDMYEKYKPVGVVYNFSMLPVLFRANEEFPGTLRPKEIPTFMFYYTPGVPNHVTPWVFDGRLRKRGFQLYANQHQSNVSNSWETIMNRSTLDISLDAFSNKDARLKTAVELLESVHHLLGWPSSLTPEIIPISPKMPLKQVGFNMFASMPRAERRKKTRAATITDVTRQGFDRALVEFVRTADKPLLFMSFGSFARIPFLRALVPYFVEELTRTHAVIVHKTWKDDKETARLCPAGAAASRSCYIQNGFIDYDKIIPYMNIIVGSGSFGLQTVALKHKKAMIMVPMITEQYFWAKNFQHFTGIYYIDVAEVYNETIEKQIRKALRTVYEKKDGRITTTLKPRVRDFVERVHRDIYARDHFLLAKTVMPIIHQTRTAHDKKRAPI